MRVVSARHISFCCRSRSTPAWSNLRVPLLRRSLNLLERRVARRSNEHTLIWWIQKFRAMLRPTWRCSGSRFKRRRLIRRRDTQWICLLKTTSCQRLPKNIPRAVLWKLTAPSISSKKVIGRWDIHFSNVGICWQLAFSWFLCLIGIGMSLRALGANMSRRSNKYKASKRIWDNCYHSGCKFQSSPRRYQRPPSSRKKRLSAARRSTEAHDASDLERKNETKTSQSGHSQCKEKTWRWGLLFFANARFLLLRVLFC